MPPSTRSTHRETTPDIRVIKTEFDTPKKTRFFDAYDHRKAGASVRSIAKEQHIGKTTAHTWLSQRATLGSVAYRSTRKRSEKLGAPSKLCKEQCLQLVNPFRNPVRDQQHEAQIEFHHLNVSKRTLQRALLQHTNKARRYKQAYIKKKMSKNNLKSRQRYGQLHQDDTIEGCWRWKLYTDEAHVDPTSQIQGEILREQGTRYDPENIQERGSKKGNVIHMAAWISYDSKAKKLIFYNDEEETVKKPKRPRKPRHRKQETDEEFAYRLLEWRASIHHDLEVKPKGNAMTQKYYCEKILPIYCNAINHLRVSFRSGMEQWALLEDGDPSHGLRKEGLAHHLKLQNWITNHNHPANSPDLNPIEAIWNIIKQRARRRIWNSIEELKEILQDEWSKVTQAEIRARIDDLPLRCKLLAMNGGAAIKSALW